MGEINVNSRGYYRRSYEHRLPGSFSLAEQPTELSKVCRYSSWPAACFCCVNLV